MPFHKAIWREFQVPEAEFSCTFLLPNTQKRYYSVTAGH